MLNPLTLGVSPPFLEDDPFPNLSALLHERLPLCASLLSLPPPRLLALALIASSSSSWCEAAAAAAEASRRLLSRLNVGKFHIPELLLRWSFAMKDSLPKLPELSMGEALEAVSEALE